jgi:hypothetical protein
MKRLLLALCITGLLQSANAQLTISPPSAGAQGSPGISGTPGPVGSPGAQGSPGPVATPTPGAFTSDTAYDATTWNGVTDVAPSKNAVRDKFVSVDAAIEAAGGITNAASEDKVPVTDGSGNLIAGSITDGSSGVEIVNQTVIIGDTSAGNQTRITITDIDSLITLRTPNLKIQGSLPTVDPEVGGQIWEDPITHVLKISRP